MCCLFGIIDYAGVLPARTKKRYLAVLSRECEERGTDATGIAYNSNGNMSVYKRPLPAHKLWYRVPNDTKVVMGHTRMATQGSEKLNYNNHPFMSEVADCKFSLAHNGVLYNDTLLRKTENIPTTKIETDSYIAVQLLEREPCLDFQSIRKMAEAVDGSFCFTILDENDNMYFVKGENPMAIYKFNGFYMYASTDEILKRAVHKLRISEPCTKVDILAGEILRISCDGTEERAEFDFSDCNYSRFFSNAYYGTPVNYSRSNSTGTALDELIGYAGCFGVTEEDIMYLHYCGFDEYDIEEMLYEPSLLDEYLQLQSCELC